MFDAHVIGSGQEQRLSDAPQQRTAQGPGGRRIAHDPGEARRLLQRLDLQLRSLEDNAPHHGGASDEPLYGPRPEKPPQGGVDAVVDQPAAELHVDVGLLSGIGDLHGVEQLSTKRKITK